MVKANGLTLVGRDRVLRVTVAGPDGRKRAQPEIFEPRPREVPPVVSKFDRVLAKADKRHLVKDGGLKVRTGRGFAGGITFRRTDDAKVPVKALPVKVKVNGWPVRAPWGVS